jgi:hypothetical protein
MSYIHTRYLHAYTISTCIHDIYIHTRYLHSYTISTCIHDIYMHTRYLTFIAFASIERCLGYACVYVCKLSCMYARYRVCMYVCKLPCVSYLVSSQLCMYVIRMCICIYVYKYVYMYVCCAHAGVSCERCACGVVVAGRASACVQRHSTSARCASVAHAL